MDSKTADELFGSSDDAGLDFFSQSETDEAAPQTTDLGHESVDYYHSSAQDNAQVAQQDPYSQLYASPAVSTPSTARPAAIAPVAQRDPYASYAPQSNGSYTPASNPSTYTPASHGTQYDPYAAIARKPSYNPYTPAQGHSYSTQQPSAYSPAPPAFTPAVPTPPAPTNTDVSKYRSTPNAYDPPIRSKPVARTPSRPPMAVPSPYTTPSGPPVRQTPPPPPAMSPVHTPYGGKPPTTGPPPRAVSPYVYRPPAATGTPPPRPDAYRPSVAAGISPPSRHPIAPPAVTSTPPPPRPSSTASNQSGPYGRHPSIPASGSGAYSRPTSAASNTQMRSPPRSQSIASVMSEPYQQPRTSSEHLRVSYEESMDDGPTPTVASGGRTGYLDSGNQIEDAYPPLEQDEILENMALANQINRDVTPPPAPAPPVDPYATLQRSSSSTYGPPMAVSRQNSLVESPPQPTPPPPKAIPPPPKANPYALPPGGVSSPPPPHPVSGITPSSSFRDVYSPLTTLAPNSNPIIDLSHSPPNTRHIPPSYDPYNPNRGPSTMSRKNTASESDHSHPGGSLYGAPAPPPVPGPMYGYAPAPEPAQAYTGANGAQYASQAPVTQGAYAPSPSLLGTNDPLGRASVRAPIFSFGFGGRVVACFHTAPGVNAFDGVGGIGIMPSRPSTALVVKTLKDCIVPSAYDVTCAGFPGPLFGDVGPGGASSVLTTAGAATKAKKTAIGTWLDATIKEAEEGVVYAGAASTQGGSAAAKAEGRLALMKLLKIWVENDGKISGSPTIDEAVRTALLGPADPSSTLGGAPVPSFGVPAFYPGEQAQGGRDSSVTYQVKGSSLDRLQELLTRGERRAAYQFALDEKLWSHALLISSSIDKDAWKEVAHEFIKTELSLGGTEQSASGRESLRLAYGLFAGDGPEAMKLLIPPASFGINGVQMHTRMSSGQLSGLDSPISGATTVPDQTWAQWKKLLAATIANQPTGDTTPTTALGDFLLSNNWVDAAHCCYLLAPTTSLLGGISTPGVRTVLFGSASPGKASTFHTSLQPIILSELAEYAKSLVPAAKGQESFQGLQHLQAYRLWHAACLAEMGEVVLAKRYTDAINATVRMSTRGSPYYTPTFIEQLEELHDRLVEAPHADKTKTWISKPSVRSLNEWITGGLEKLIQGDEAPPKEDQPQGKKSLEVTPAIGPFSHYSAISSNTPSAHPSPSPSYANLHSASSSIARTESASGYRPAPSHSSTLPTPAPPRAASAMDYPRGRASPAPKVSSAGATTTSFRNAYHPAATTTAEPASTEEKEDAPRPLYAQWWGESNDEGVTPTASSFSQDLNEDQGNFISLMDSDPTLVPTISSTGNSNSHRNDFDEDEDDLGFGNSKPKKQQEQVPVNAQEPQKSNGNASKPVPQAAQSSTPAPADAAGAAPAKGWFSFLRRGDATPKPVKASLGEESAFYYDADLKKWVNKKAGAEAAAPAVPAPPPSRSQTASPGRSGFAPNTATPPPPRSVSAMPHSTLAPPPRPSSTLSSTSDTGSYTDSSMPPSRGSPAPPMSGLPPRGTGQTPPPSTSSPAGSVSGRPGAKRNARSRYVDVFQA